MTMTQTNFHWAHYLVKYEVWPPPRIMLSADWSKKSEEELIKLYQTANPAKSNQAFAEIFNRYRLTVDNYVKNKASSEWEARAVFCDVWLKSMDKLKTFVYRGQPLEHWFRSVAYRTVQEHYRKRGRQSNKVNRFVEAYRTVHEHYKKGGRLSDKANRFVEGVLKQLDNPHDPAEITLADELREEADERFFEACDSLKNPLQRRIIKLIYFHQITNSDEIAKSLGVKSGAIIRSNHSRALKKLEKYFKKQRGER